MLTYLCIWRNNKKAGNLKRTVLEIPGRDKPIHASQYWSQRPFVDEQEDVTLLLNKTHKLPQIRDRDGNSSSSDDSFFWVVSPTGLLGGINTSHLPAVSAYQTTRCHNTEKHGLKHVRHSVRQYACMRVQTRRTPSIFRQNLVLVFCTDTITSGGHNCVTLTQTKLQIKNTKQQADSKRVSEVATSAYQLRHVSAISTGNFILGTSVKIRRQNPNLVKIRQNYRALYMNT